MGVVIDTSADACLSEPLPLQEVIDGDAAILRPNIGSPSRAKMVNPNLWVRMTHEKMQTLLGKVIGKVRWLSGSGVRYVHLDFYPGKRINRVSSTTGTGPRRLWYGSRNKISEPPRAPSWNGR